MRPDADATPTAAAALAGPGGGDTEGVGRLDMTMIPLKEGKSMRIEGGKTVKSTVVVFECSGYTAVFIGFFFFF